MADVWPRKLHFTGSFKAEAINLSFNDTVGWVSALGSSWSKIWKTVVLKNQNEKKFLISQVNWLGRGPQGWGLNAYFLNTTSDSDINGSQAHFEKHDLICNQIIICRILCFFWSEKKKLAN